MTKTQEILEKLESGLKPAQIITEGYKSWKVYKINHDRNIAKNSKGRENQSEPTNKTGDDKNLDIENDPEILELKKALRKAELEKQISEIIASNDLVVKIEAIEEALKGLVEKGDTIDWLFESIIDLQTIINNPPLSELYQKHRDLTP
ncbi:hypothetical protein ACFLUP_03300 [Chloroflexota bacterium]